MTKEKWEEYSRDLERYLKNRPSINLLYESNLEELRESVDTTKLDRIWDSFEKGILYVAKKNISHKKLKKGAPNNIRSNKVDKNSASAIIKKDVISLSRIYKSLKCQYKTTKVANLLEDVVADFNHQVKEINEKYGLEIMLSLTANLWQEELQPFDLKIWQNNLNCQIIYKAKELNLTIRHEPDFWKIHGTGPRFREVLEPKLFIKAHRSLQSLDFFFLNQVISEESTKLITWKQIKFIRGKSCKGKAATWFSSIEKKYLTNLLNRKISEGLSTHNPNNMSIIPGKADIKKDNRIKD
ncbi:16023_t:CDS:2 [Gigaspora margarita]|uniref:16023_t:CDS:1 n=1 Tax=Gigaspora margarita TaxID=4874 RepID=A0ABN7WC61_GIGMA|nr:16023_t:CDS:2 [Gigaspora margarita]